jgi:hypothetical protein
MQTYWGIFWEPIGKLKELGGTPWKPFGNLVGIPNLLRNELWNRLQE